MADSIIQVEGLGKKYQLGRARTDTLRDSIAQILRAPFRRRSNNNASEEFWALREISFTVKSGEVVGIIGRNGAGKSTLLKILSRITDPTLGRVSIAGRVASLLEVGTGFHPELTGRENIFLNGAILGMRRAEIRSKFDEIVAFAEVDRFLDTPVKHYSSGMYVRLAFAVAAHLEPEILIVDEVLAVGDAAFQKKCLGKMGEVARGHGRTVLFVSHNMVAVQSLCRRTIFLQDGRVVDDGPAAVGTARYLQSSLDATGLHEWADPSSAPGSEALRIHRVRVRPEDGSADDVLTMQTPFVVELDFWRTETTRSAHITWHLLNDQATVVLTSGSPSTPSTPGLHRATCHFPGQLLNSGRYTLKLLIVEDETKVTYSNESFASFTVVDLAVRKHAWLGREPGVVQPNLRWEIAAAAETIR
jgi:lipopolysaccharide transport system ATP-binding protein